MGRRIFTISVILAGYALCLASISGAEAPTDSLWLKAVALSEKNQDLVPGTIESYMQQVDKHGKPKNEDKYHQSSVRLSLRDDGEIEYETVKVIKDGEDITEEERDKEKEKSEKDEDSESHEMEGYHPFDPDSQGRLSIERQDETELLDGKSMVVYEFTEQPEDDEDEKVTGKVWFDVATGVPAKLEYTTDPLPKRVKRMITTLKYNYFPPDSLVVGSVSVEATGGILFIKRHFHVDMTFDEYWRLPEGCEE